jgi:hypothetical protein
MEIQINYGLKITNYAAEGCYERAGKGTKNCVLRYAMCDAGQGNRIKTLSVLHGARV